MSEDEIKPTKEEYYMERVNALLEVLNLREFFEYIGDGDYYSVGVCGLLDSYNKEKEKNKKLQIRCKELIEEKQELNTALLYDNISKDKIREQMKIIENECKTCKYNHILCDERKPLANSIKYCLKLEYYDVLKSLLEE